MSLSVSMAWNWSRDVRSVAQHIDADAGLDPSAFSAASSEFERWALGGDRCGVAGRFHHCCTDIQCLGAITSPYSYLT